MPSEEDDPSCSDTGDEVRGVGDVVGEAGGERQTHRPASSSAKSSRKTTKTNQRNGRGRTKAGKAANAVVHALAASVGSIPGALGTVLPLLQRVGSVVMANRFQTYLLVANVVLLKVAANRLKRARFAAHVRVAKELKPDDLKYMLGKLPPWISSPEWEAGKPAQELLGLLWPALNSTICLALKNVIEDRLQGSSEYGRINFSRFSLGRTPPQIFGIKAVPLHEEDVLAMVVDLDVRWAGEPDVVLHLSRLKRVTLGLKNLQVSTMVRLVFTPIIEDPPFFQRMTVTLLNKPFIDFTINVLGGPDIMSLPAVSSWLHAAILGLTDRFIVWPKEANVALIPNLRSKNNLPMLSALASSPPMGVLIVTIEEAKLQKRRSTFLGRYKLPNPRIAVVTPKGETDGVAQMTMTGVYEQTLEPSFKHSSSFVIGSMEQPLRVLLSHRRMGTFFGADMPLGSAEVDVMDLLKRHGDGDGGGNGDGSGDDVGSDWGRQSARTLARTASAGNLSFKSCLSTKSRDLSGFGDYFDVDVQVDGYESACSVESTSRSPQAVGSIRHVVFASPPLSPTVSGTGRTGRTGRTSPDSPSSPSSSSISFTPFSRLAAADLGSPTPTTTKIISDGNDQPQEHADWDAVHTPPSKTSVPWQTDDGQQVVLDQFLDTYIDSSRSARENCSKECEGSTWVNVNASAALTMSSLLQNALQPLKGLPSTPFENSLAELGGESNVNQIKAVLRSFRSFLKAAFPGENDDSDGESVDGDGRGEGHGIGIGIGGGIGARNQPGNETSRAGAETARRAGPINLENPANFNQTEHPAKVKISYRWIPVSADRPALQNEGTQKETERETERETEKETEKETERENHNENGKPRTSTVPRPFPSSSSSSSSSSSGVVGIRVAFTKIDYGDNPLHPILSLSILPTNTTLVSAPLEHLSVVSSRRAQAREEQDHEDATNAASPRALPTTTTTTTSSTTSITQNANINLTRLAKSHRVFSTECQSGHRPGVLHWGQVFHLPVWNAATSKIRVELGNISSALKLSSYGTDLFLLEATTGLYDEDVDIEASTNIPLKDVIKKGFVDQNYRLREAKTEKIPGVLDEQRLDIGRVAISTSWHPMMMMRGERVS